MKKGMLYNKAMRTMYLSSMRGKPGVYRQVIMLFYINFLRSAAGSYMKTLYLKDFFFIIFLLHKYISAIAHNPCIKPFRF